MSTDDKFTEMLIVELVTASEKCYVGSTIFVTFWALSGFSTGSTERGMILGASDCSSDFGNWPCVPSNTSFIGFGPVPSLAHRSLTGTQGKLPSKQG